MDKRARMKQRVYPPVKGYQSLTDIIGALAVQRNRFESEFEHWAGGYGVVYTYRARTGLFHLLGYLRDQYGIKRVHVPSYICKEVVDSIRQAGMALSFVDNELETMAMDATHIRLDRDDAVLWVNYFGLASTLPDAIARSGAIIIEDNATSMRPAGEQVDFAIYSFGKGKVLSGGDGGAVVVKDDKYIGFSDYVELKTPGWMREVSTLLEYLAIKVLSSAYLYRVAVSARRSIAATEHIEDWEPRPLDNVGLKMLSVSRRLANIQFVRLGRLMRRGKHLQTHMIARMEESADLRVLAPDSTEASFYVVNLLVKEREQLRAFLERKGVFTVVPWKYSTGTRLSGRRFGNSDQIASELLQIRIDPDRMDEEVIAYIAESLKSFYRRQ